MRKIFLLLALLVAVAASARAQSADSFVPVWIERDGVLSAEALDAALSGIAAKDADPTNIVVLIHGFDVPRSDSTQQFEAVGKLLADEFAKRKQKVVVVGLQWNSDTDAGLLALAGAYMDTVPVARSVGHQGARQLMLGIHEKFPKAKISTMGHSMGCEVTAAAFAPTMKYKEGSAGEGTVAPAFEPDKDVRANLVVLAGSDLDFDVFAQSGIEARREDPLVRMMWMTLSPVIGEKDEVLKMREMVRGQAAGNVFPLMTQAQYDSLFGRKALFIDNEEIPTSHDFLLYYNADRLAQLVPAMLWLASPNSVPEPTAFQDMDKVMMAPDNAEALARFLDFPDLNTQLYALWRLEKLNCGGSVHLADGYLPGIAAMMRHKPRQALSARKSDDCPCVTVKKGYWPTVKQFTKAGAPPWAQP